LTWFRIVLHTYFSIYRFLLRISGLRLSAYSGCLVILLSFGLLLTSVSTSVAQDKTHSKKLEKVKKKKSNKKKEKRSAQYQGKIEPTATPAVKGNPTKKSKKTSGKHYQERIGTGKAPRGTKGTNYAGKRKSKTIEKSKGTRHRGDPVPVEPKIAGNPTKKKQTSGVKYQQRIGVDSPPRGTKGTNYSGSGKQKTINASKGTKYKGDKVPVEANRIKGNPTKVDKKGKGYQERTGQQGPPTGTKGTRFAGKGQPKSIRGGSDGTSYAGKGQPKSIRGGSDGTSYTGKGQPKSIRSGTEGTNYQGKGRPKAIRGGTEGTNYQGKGRPKAIKGGNDGTRFAGNGRPKTIKGGNDGTTYAGQSTAGSTSTAGGRTTIYGERGRNFKKGGVPDIKLQEQGAEWKGNLKGNKFIEGTPGTRFKGNMKAPNREIYDYGGDWAGDMKLKKVKPDTRASTYAIKGMRAKEILQGPGTTFRGHLDSPKKIVGWDGADFAGHLKVKSHRKVKTEGTRFAGNLRVKPNAKVKTPGTTFAGHYKVNTSSRIKTEGVDFQGNFKTSTRFFKNRDYRKKSREQQLFAGNYKVRRTKGKDLHPSATYSGGRLKDPNKRNDLSRKWKLLLAKTKKNADQPKHLKNKYKKPKYDPKERDIWNN